MLRFGAAAAGLPRFPAAVPGTGPVVAAAVAAIMAALATTMAAGAEPDDAAPAREPPPAQQTPAPETPAPDGAGTHDIPAAGASAPQPGPEARAEPGYRFAFHPSGNGYLRLDRATGAVSVCTPANGTWACTPGRDDRTAIDAEIARLQRDNAALKNALLERGIALPGSVAPAPPVPVPMPAPGSGAGPGAAPPAQAGNATDDDAGKSAAEADREIPRPPQTVPPTPGMVPAPGERRIMDTVTRTWRRLVEIVSNLRRDLQ